MALALVRRARELVCIAWGLVLGWRLALNRREIAEEVQRVG